jgi:hypothetical protein
MRSCDSRLKRCAVFAVIKLLGLNDLREQLSQSPPPANRPGGAAVLAANLHAEKRGPNDSDPPSSPCMVTSMSATIPWYLPSVTRA